MFTTTTVCVFLQHNMAPWRKHLIEAQLERVTKYNYDDVAKRIVLILDSRLIIQSSAHLIVQRINRWYMPSYSEKLDIEKRNICDNFIASLLHAIALSTKHIKDVPTKEGLSGIPLIKHDLLSTSLHGRQRIGPVIVALYNSGNMMVDDVMEIVEACLEPIQSFSFLQRISDAIIILEFTGKEMMKHNPFQCDVLIKKLGELLNQNQDWASKKVRICDRNIPNLFQRFFTIQRNLEEHEDKTAIIAEEDDCSSDRFSEKCTSSIYPMTISDITEEESLFNQTITSTTLSCSDDEDEDNSIGFTNSSMDDNYSFSELESVNGVSPALPSSTFLESTSDLHSEILPKSVIIRSPYKKPSMQTLLAQERQITPSQSMILQDVFVPLQVDVPQSALLSECLIGKIGLNVENDDQKTPTINKDKFEIITPSTNEFKEEETTICSIVQVGEASNLIRFFFPSLALTKESVESITQTMKIELNNEHPIENTNTSSLTTADKFQLLNDGSAFQTFHIGEKIEIDVIYSANMTLSQISNMGQRISQILACKAY